MVQCLYSEGISPQALMQKDQQLLDQACGQECFLHLFRWPLPTLSLGALSAQSKLLQPMESGFSRVMRPTGGGVMLHGHDLCFSMVVGPEHPLRQAHPWLLYEGVHRALMQALEKHYRVLKGRLSMIDPEGVGSSSTQHAMSCCMLHPTKYDLALDRKKLIGSAQRRKRALLHQSSLHVEAPDRELIKNQFVDAATYATMIGATSTWLSEHLAIDWRELEALVRETLVAYLEDKSAP